MYRKDIDTMKNRIKTLEYYKHMEYSFRQILNDLNLILHEVYRTKTDDKSRKSLLIESLQTRIGLITCVIPVLKHQIKMHNNTFKYVIHWVFNSYTKECTYDDIRIYGQCADIFERIERLINQELLRENQPYGSGVSYYATKISNRISEVSEFMYNYKYLFGMEK